MALGAYLRSLLWIPGTLLFASVVSAQAPSYGVCERQLIVDVTQRFDQNITRIDWSLHTSRDSRSGYTSQALVYTGGCPGYHVYEIFGKEFDCFHRVHYGEVRNYIRYRNSGDGC